MEGGMERAIADSIKSTPPAIVQQIEEIPSSVYAGMLVNELNKSYLEFKGQARKLGDMAAEIKSSYPYGRIVVDISPDTGYVRFVGCSMEAEIFDFGYCGLADSVVVRPFSIENEQIILKNMPDISPKIFYDFYKAVGHACPAADKYLYNKPNYRYYKQGSQKKQPRRNLPRRMHKG